MKQLGKQIPLLAPRGKLRPLALRRTEELELAGEAPEIGKQYRIDWDYIDVEVGRSVVVVAGRDIVVRVIEVREIKDALAVLFTVTSIDLPVYLGKNGGYTNDPAQALWTTPEPGEADVDPKTLNRYAEDNAARFRAQREDQIRRRRAKARRAKLKQAEEIAAKKGLDLEEHEARIDREIEAMRKKGEAA